MSRRVVRLVIGIVIILAGLFVIVGEQMAGVSSNAFINAQVLILRAPIDGEIALQVKSLGTRVTPNQFLASISDPRPDEIRLTDLQREVRRINIDLERLQALGKELTPIREAFARQSADYAKGRISQLETRLSEASATLDAVQARQRDSEAAFRRAA
jgi:multidrug resistance efflux pump